MPPRNKARDPASVVEEISATCLCTLTKFADGSFCFQACPGKACSVDFPAVHGEGAILDQLKAETLLGNFEGAVLHHRTQARS